MLRNSERANSSYLETTIDIDIQNRKQRNKGKVITNLYYWPNKTSHALWIYGIYGLGHRKINVAILANKPKANYANVTEIQH